MSDNNPITHYLTDNPRMIGVLFTITLLLAQAGSATAHGSSIVGP